jgi:hypothetical protein
VAGLRHVSIKFRYALEDGVEIGALSSDLDKLTMIPSRPNYLMVVFAIVKKPYW